jgi:hypothetical protein
MFPHRGFFYFHQTVSWFPNQTKRHVVTPSPNKKAALTHVKYQEGFFAAAMRVFHGKAHSIHLDPVSLLQNKREYKF